MGIQKVFKRPLVLSLTFLGLSCTFAAQAQRQTILLQPGKTATPVRIDFDYSFQKALPPFEKEPALTNKEVARGLIPTVPPTAFLRNITDNALYLNTDHTRDFVNGRLATYHSTYQGHVFFRDLSVATVRDGLEIPYTLSVFTYEHFCSGWLNVESGWTGYFEVAGRQWKLTVVDNLDGEIGTNDALHLQPMPANSAPAIAITPVPRTLFLDGHTFDLAFTFKAAATGAVLQAAITETKVPLGTLQLATHQVRYVCLSNQFLTAVLDATTSRCPAPAGTYAISDCLLDEVAGSFKQPSFIRCNRTLTIEPGHVAVLNIGPPLRNTVQVARDRNVLRLTYQLLGQADEQYEYYNWRDRPRFAVWNGPIRIGGGSLPFG